MKLVDFQKAEIWEQAPGFEGLCEHVARCAAVCYNSKPKTGGAAVDFVQKLISMKHGRALEFGTLSLRVVKPWISRTCKNWAATPQNDDHSPQGTVINLRHFLESTNNQLSYVEKYMRKFEKELPLKRVTIHYPAIPRSIADEFRTHTALSTLMQSTRYVKPADNDDIEFVKPHWYGRNICQDTVLEFQLKNAEQAYMDLLKLTEKKQDARDVLPLCVKTEMVQCGFTYSWDHFLKLRTDKAAHPQAQQIALTVQEALDSLKEEEEAEEAQD